MKHKGPISIDALKVATLDVSLRAPERPRSSVEQLEAERDAARAALTKMEAERDYARRQEDAARAALRRVQDMLSAEERKNSGLDRDFLADLIRLCHPDRHAAVFGVLANKVTARLLAMRK